jgi:hypothetical protein
VQNAYPGRYHAAAPTNYGRCLQYEAEEVDVLEAAAARMRLCRRRGVTGLGVLRIRLPLAFLQCAARLSFLAANTRRRQQRMVLT